MAASGVRVRVGTLDMDVYIAGHTALPEHLEVTVPAKVPTPLTAADGHASLRRHASTEVNPPIR